MEIASHKGRLRRNHGERRTTNPTNTITYTLITLAPTPPTPLSIQSGKEYEMHLEEYERWKSQAIKDDYREYVEKEEQREATALLDE